MEEGGCDGFRPERAQRCCSAHSRRCCRPHASLVKAVITRSFSARAVAPGCMAGYLWPSTAGRPLEKISLAGFIRKRGPTGIPCARALGAKILCLRAGCRTALALCPRLADFGSVSSFRPLRTSRPGASPRTCWFKPTGQGARLRFRFRLSSGNTTVACPVM